MSKYEGWIEEIDWDNEEIIAVMKCLDSWEKFPNIQAFISFKYLTKNQYESMEENMCFLLEIDNNVYFSFIEEYYTEEDMQKAEEWAEEMNIYFNSKKD